VTGPSGGASKTAGAPVSIAIPSSIAGLKEGSRELARWLAEAGAGREVEDKAHLVLDEIVTHLIRYAFPDGREHPIAVTFALSSHTLVLTFEDEGIPFDPCRAPWPRKPETLADAPVGGRGLLLVRNAAKRLAYERTAAGRNRLTVTLDRA
jgi:anti-sigma regulatory factor (Ser/Thr protein kinase)